MTFGEKIILVRKQLKWSQDDLAKKIGTSAPIIGRYEREEIKPSIEVASKLADALEVTLDYLLGKSDNMTLDKKSLQRLQDIEQLLEEDKKNIFYTIDNLIKAAKLKNIAAL
ncbi:helix-turn-helix domain-containing protein [Chryseobacterium gossypii]|uniref:helix-turn-helix domain-containing protein n=1 Tax=Chryseobacterium gossypii TaxID=3231602 RepID=UPI003525E813